MAMPSFKALDRALMKNGKENSRLSRLLGEMEQEQKKLGKFMYNEIYKQKCEIYRQAAENTKLKIKILKTLS